MHSFRDMPETATRKGGTRNGGTSSRLPLVLAALSVIAVTVTVAAALTEVSRAQSGLASRGEIYTVERVIDGDTVEVDRPISGDDSVRLIGVDTPETVDPNEPVQPFGPEASEFTTQRLEGQRVALEFDEERLDSFDRPLAYVWASQDELFNETLVAEGLAQVQTVEPNVRYEQRFLAAQEEARAAGLGIWGLTTAERCELDNHTNGIGEGSPECSRAQAESQPAAAPKPGQPDPQMPAPQMPAPVGANPTTEPDQTSNAQTGAQPQQTPQQTPQRTLQQTPDTGGPPLLALAFSLIGLGAMTWLVARRLC